MTTKEFSTEFDILYNNIMSDTAPGLNEYEKSVFLTQAQESLVLELYRGDSLSTGYDNNEEIRKHLSPLIKTKEFYPKDNGKLLGVNSYFVELPKDEILAIVHEMVEPCYSSCDFIEIKPISHDTLNYYIKNPFLGPRSGEVLRVDFNGGLNLIGDSMDKKKYVMRYLKKPYPIILEDLSSYDVSINNNTSPLSEDNPSELPPVLHRQILLNAIQLAKAVWKS